MLAKCANPECPTPFHYLREGKVFRVDFETAPMLVNGRRPRRIEHFWLCGPCSKHLTLTYRKDQGVLLIPLVGEVRRATAS